MDYAALQATAHNLIAQVGLSVSLSRLGVKYASNVKGVFVESDNKDETSSSSSLLAQTSQRTRRLLLSGLSKEPLVGDTVTADKRTYLIEAIEVVRPAATTLLYKCEVVG